MIIDFTLPAPRREGRCRRMLCTTYAPLLTGRRRNTGRGRAQLTPPWVPRCEEGCLSTFTEMSDEGGSGGGLTTCRDELLPTRMLAPRTVGWTMAGRRRVRPAVFWNFYPLKYLYCYFLFRVPFWILQQLIVLELFFLALHRSYLQCMQYLYMRTCAVWIKCVLSLHLKAADDVHEEGLWAKCKAYKWPLALMSTQATQYTSGAFVNSITIWPRSSVMFL